jgi:uncharacterized protein (UPF0332 family)
MAFADELLSQAHGLATMDTGTPVQANLRRSISSAYYAVFHLLISEAVQSLFPQMPELGDRVSRAFSHSEMKKVCTKFAQTRPPDDVATLLPEGVSDRLRNIAKAFSSLQQARHDADYDTGLKLSRDEALSFIADAHFVFEDWQRIRNTDEATVFLAALAFGARWSK